MCLLYKTQGREVPEGKYNKHVMPYATGTKLFDALEDALNTVS